MTGLVVKTSSRGIVYSDRGEGPTIVLLHGWCLNRQVWMYQEEALIGAHRVVCPDLPGFGDSAALAGPYDLRRYGAELAAFLTEVGGSQKLIAGFALGAAIAMAAVANQGAQPEKMLLVGVPSAATAAYSRMPRAMRRDWPEFARRSAVAICKQPQSEATLAWLGSMFSATPLPVALATVGLLGEFEPLPLAPQVGVSTVLVHGADDDVVPVAVSQACADAMPDARLEVIADSGHLVLLDQKERLADLMMAVIGISA